MSYLNEQILRQLKAARNEKGLSQRELSAKSGVPQSHISKIERGDVDLRASSLIALARVLDLELALIPRKTVPAVQSIVRTNQQTKVASKEYYEAYQLEQTVLAVMAQTATRHHNDMLSSMRILRRAAEGNNIDKTTAEKLKKTRRILESALIDHTDLNQALDKSYQKISALIKTLPKESSTDEAVPAYRLEEDDD